MRCGARRRGRSRDRRARDALSAATFRPRAIHAIPRPRRPAAMLVKRAARSLTLARRHCQALGAAHAASSRAPWSASAAIRPCRRCSPRRCSACRPSLHEQNAVMGRANRLLARACSRDRPRFPADCGGARALGDKADADRQSGAPGRARRGAAALSGTDARRRFRLLVVRRQPGRARLFRRRAAGDRAAARDAAAAARHHAAGARRGRSRVRERLCGDSASKPRSRPSSPTCRAAHRGRASGHRRSGASTVSELAVIGRPAHSGALSACARPGPGRQCGGLPRPARPTSSRSRDFTPERLAANSPTLMDDPDTLDAMAPRPRNRPACPMRPSASPISC